MSDSSCLKGGNVMSPQEELLTSDEVADMFRVKPRTIQRWARDGRITRRRTPGGHYRFARSEAEALLSADLAVPQNENGPDLAIPAPVEP
jgi:excisionase family DNA binding protein